MDSKSPFSLQETILTKVIRDLQFLQTDLRGHSKLTGLHDLKLKDCYIEYVTYICHGLCAKEVAIKMGVALGTINGYREKVFEKLDCKNITQAAYILIKLGLIK